MKRSTAAVLTLALASGAQSAGYAEEFRGASLLVAQAESAPPAAYDPMAPGGPSAVPAPDEGEAVETNPELGGLPDTPGVEETYYLCSACHSIALVKQQHLTPERWNYLWTWMVEEQGMPEQDQETKETILSYLNRHFSPEQ